MAVFRKTLFWIHLAIGILAGIVILILSFTGVLLTYQQQMTSWADKRTYRLAGTTGPRLPIEEAVRIAAQAAGAQPSNVTVRRDLNSALEVAFGRERLLLVDPYTGAVLGAGASRTRSFFRMATNVHRTLGWRTAGGKVRHELVRISNLLFLVQVVTGAYLWFPRKLAWRHFRSVLLFRTKVTGRARDFNWHNVIGVWMLAPLFVVVITGVVMSYPWANALLFRATGSPLPTQGARPGPTAEGPRAQRGSRTDNNSQVASTTGLEILLQATASRATEWRAISFRPPESATAAVTFSVETGIRGRPDKRSQWTFARNGQLTRKETFADNSRGRQMRMWVRFAHTGEAAGVPGQTLAGIASAGTCVLVITGFMLSLRRLSSWRNRRREGRRENEEPEVSVEDYARPA